MKHGIVGVFVAMALVGCASAPSQEEQQEEQQHDLVEVHPNVGVTEPETIRDPTPPNICFGSCSRTPTIEPVGQICWLTGSSCMNSILTCYYHCEPIEDSLSLSAF